MSMIIAFIIGVVAGFLAVAALPRPRGAASLILALGVGVAGAYAGYFLAWTVGWAEADRLEGTIAAIVGAVVAVVAMVVVARARGTSVEEPTRR